MPKVAIIANPHSKSNKRNPSFLTELEDSSGANRQIFITEDLNALEAAVKRCRDEKIEIIGICGGDGSILHTINLIYQTNDHTIPCKVAVLGGGTMNTVALSLGLKHTYEEACTKFLALADDAANQVRTYKVAPIIVEDRLGFLYADGSFVRVLEAFYRNKGGIRKITAFCLKLISAALLQNNFFKEIVTNPRRVVTNADGDAVLQQNSIGLVVASIDQLPLRFPLLAKRVDKVTDFQVMAVNCKPNRLLYWLPWIMISNKNRSTKLRFFTKGTRFSVDCDQGFPYTLDGEVFTSQQATIEIRQGPPIEFVELA